MAEAWKRQGYDVDANLSGWDRPKEIVGLQPDLWAKRGDKIIVGTVVSDEDVEANRKQFAKLVEYAELDENVSFRIYLASENGLSKLLKIF